MASVAHASRTPRRAGGSRYLNHPELHATSLADHVLIPRRVPNELHIGFIYAVDGQNLALRVVRDCRAHAAARGRERHFHFHFGAAFRPLCQLTIVNHTEINHVHMNLGVETLPQLVPDRFW